MLLSQEEAMFERQSCQPFLDGFDEDPDCGHNHHGAFKSGGEKRNALESVEERRSRRLGAQAQAERGERHGDDVPRIPQNRKGLRLIRSCNTQQTLPAASQHPTASDMRMAKRAARSSRSSREKAAVCATEVVLESDTALCERCIVTRLEREECDANHINASPGTVLQEGSMS